MTTDVASPTALPKPITSPTTSRKRGREDFSDDHLEGSPSKQRLLEGDKVQKLFSPIQEKENTSNSPMLTPMKRSRIKEFSRKLKQRTSIGGLLSPKPRTEGNGNYPHNILSPPLPTPSLVMKTEDGSSSNNPSSKKRRSIRMTSADRRREAGVGDRTPRRIPIHPEISQESTPRTPGTPTLHRSVSMYSFSTPEKSQATEEPTTPSGSLTHRSAVTPSSAKKKKKKSGVGSLSLRSSRKRSITDFKQLFSRSSQSSITLESIQAAEETKVAPRRYFGFDLVELMERQRTIQPLEHFKVPYFVDVCCDNIRQRFLEEDGLFRISPSLTYLEIAVDDIENTEDSGKSYLTRCGDSEDRPQLKAHVYSGLLKKFLRELPGSLLGSENYHQWISYMSKEESIQVQTVRDYILELPADHYHLLECIIHLALDISKHQEKNRMTVDNLATVIGPNILWSDDSSMDPLESSRHIGLINQITAFLIHNYEAVFAHSVSTPTPSPTTAETQPEKPDEEHEDENSSSVSNSVDEEDKEETQE